MRCISREANRLTETFFIFGWQIDDDYSLRWSVLRYDPHMQQTERVANMENRLWATYSGVGESIFVIGGETEEERYTRSVVEFLMREGRWRERAPLAVERKCHAAAVVKAGGEKTLIGVFGGVGGVGASCEVYDVSQNRWHKLPDMREARSQPAAASLPNDGRIFVFGGQDESSDSELASVEFCQLGADWEAKVTSAHTVEFWQPAASMRTARRAPAATQFKGRIIVAGGLNAEGILNVVEMFTPPDARCKLGQWTELTGMNQPRSHFTLLTSTDLVFAIGTRGDNTVETLTPPEDSADCGNDLTSWSWSSKNPVENIDLITGAASIRM
uniref:Influenza virus NS1A-binding protein homolog A n=1 Tax=Schistocephalus solidus TaxID=70667 RepID=A0A0X3PWC6_SCHSO